MSPAAGHPASPTAVRILLVAAGLSFFLVDARSSEFSYVSSCVFRESSCRFFPLSGGAAYISGSGSVLYFDLSAQGQLSSFCAHECMSSQSLS